MNTTRRSLCAALLACAGASAPFAPAAEAVEVTSDWKIVLPETRVPVVDRSLALVAEELQRDLAEARGFRLPIVKGDAPSPAFRLGEAAAKKAGLLPDDLAYFQNVIAEKGGDIYLFGADRPGAKNQSAGDWLRALLPTCRATLRFLKRSVGVRYVMPGVTGTEVRARDTVALADGTFDRENPPLDFGPGRTGGMIYDFANGIYWLGSENTYGGHSYEPACPAEKYGKDHPEYFGLLSGKRVVKRGGPLCISNSAVQQLMVDELCRQFDAGHDVCQLGQQDGFVGCECAACANYGGEVAKGDWGEKLWILHADIARRIERLRPGKIVHIMCYGPTARPPKSFRVFPSNVMIEQCSYGEADFARWKDYTVPHGFTVYIYLWGDYPLPGFTAKQSFASAATFAKRFLNHGVRGVYRCGYGELYGMEGASYYVFNGLLQDPGADVRGLVTEYCDAAFGAAAPAMQLFYEKLDRQIQLNAMNGVGWPNGIAKGVTGGYCALYSGNSLSFLAQAYNPDAVAFLEKCLRRAERTKDLTERQRRRLRLVRLEFEYAKNLGQIATFYAAYRFAPSKELFHPLAEAIRARNRFLDELYPKGRTSPKKIDGWPDYTPFGGFDRRMLSTNGRLGATLSSPLAWDVDALERSGNLPGAAVKRGAATACAAEPPADDFERGEWTKAPWQKIGGMDGGDHGKLARFKALYDERAVYVAVETTLRDDWKVQPFGKDGPVWHDESLDLFFDPFGEKEKYFHFIVGPCETSLYDDAFGLISDPLHPLFNKYDPSWNSKLATFATRRANGVWRVFFRLPYEEFGAQKPAKGEKWCFNVGRTWAFAPGRDEKPAYALWSPNFDGTGMTSADSMGDLVFE